MGFSEQFVVEKEQFHIDTFQFRDKCSSLESIDINAERKKCVRLDVSGSFPQLERVSYKGSFGKMWGMFTGDYPKLDTLDFECSACRMEMDCRGSWHQPATVVIRNENAPIILMCPRDVGVVIRTKVGPQGKVLIHGSYQKKGRGIWNRTYHNSLVGVSPITVTFIVESYGQGSITLR